MLNKKDKFRRNPRLDRSICHREGYKYTLTTLWVLALVLTMAVFGAGAARAQDLAKLLDWSFFPNEAITFSPSTPSVIAISNGGLHLSTMDQSDMIENTLKGWGFKKGISLFNTVWDATQQWLTVAQSLNLPDGSVGKSATAWTDMTGNVLLMHFDAMPAVTGTSMSHADSSVKALAATCTNINGGSQAYCPVLIPNVRLGGALRFDGLDDELIVSANPIPSGSTVLALEAWVNPMLMPTAQQPYFGLISQGETAGVANYELGLQLSGATITAVFNMANLGSITGGTVVPKRWSHVVGTYDGSSMVLYVDGVQVAAKSVSGPVAFSDKGLSLGTTWISGSKGSVPYDPKKFVAAPNDWTVSAGHFGGMLDEATVYAKSLTAQEVQDHYTHQASVTLPDGSQQAVPIAGVFDSRGMTVGSPVSWDSISWIPSAPYGVQLPDANGSESGYSKGNNTLMNGNVLLLHLNEAFGATTLVDTSPISGAGNNGVCGGIISGMQTTCPKMGQPGKFDKAATMNGTTDAISVPLPQSPTKAITLEAWVYMTPLWSGIDTNVGWGVISKGPQDSGLTSYPVDYELVINSATTFIGPGSAKNAYNAIFSLPGHNYVDPMPQPYGTNVSKSYLYGSSLPFNTWSHLVGTYDGTTMKLYVNGVLESAQVVSGGDIANSNNPVLVGMRPAALPYCYDAAGAWVKSGDITKCKKDAAGNPIVYRRSSRFPGMLDEVAIYDRALTQTEVTAHFVRGAMKPKVQIRFCKQTDCSDMPFFVGPDLTSGSYFTAPAIPTSQSITQTVDLTELGLPKASTFQYQVLFESSMSAAFPSIQSVTIEPPHFPTTNPSATINTQKEFAKVTSFDDTVVSKDAGGAAGNGEVWYQFSADGQKWFFCSGNFWMDVADVPVISPDISQITSPKSQIQSCLKDVPFTAAGGVGTLWFRTFFHSPTGVDSIDLNNVKIGYELPAPPPVDGPPKDVKVAPIKVLPFTLTTSEGTALQFGLKKPDPDKTYGFTCAVGCPSGLSVDYATGAVEWTPGYSQAGSYDLQFQIAGDETVTQPIQIVVKETNAAPQIDVVGEKVVMAGQTLEFALSAKDPDGGTPQFTIASPKQEGMSLDSATGAFSWVTKPEQAGTYMVIFRAKDDLNSGIYGDQSVVVTVSKSNVVSEPAAPTAVGTETTTSPEATPIQPAALAQPEAPAAPAEPAAPAIVSGCALIR